MVSPSFSPRKVRSNAGTEGEQTATHLAGSHRCLVNNCNPILSAPWAASFCFFFSNSKVRFLGNHVVKWLVHNLDTSNPEMVAISPPLQGYLAIKPTGAASGSREAKLWQWQNSLGCPEHQERNCTFSKITRCSNSSTASLQAAGLKINTSFSSPWDTNVSSKAQPSPTEGADLTF